MSWRNTGILFLLLILLGGVAYWQSQQEPEEEPTPTPAITAPEPVELVSGIASEDILSLTITNLISETERTFVQLEPGLWFQSVPTNTGIITTTFTGQVSGLTRLTSSRAIEPEVNPLSAYGLDAPTLQIAFNAGDEQYLFFVGNGTPVGNSYYLQQAGDDRVHVVFSSVVNGMQGLLDNPPLMPAEEPTPTPMPE